MHVLFPIARELRECGWTCIILIRACNVPEKKRSAKLGWFIAQLLIHKLSNEDTLIVYK